MKAKISEKRVQCGLYLPNFGKRASAEAYVRLARRAEARGWDGFFLWDHILEWNKRVVLFDSFTMLAAIAAATKRIRIGTTVTPLAKSKPWIIARQTTTLDHLSSGRMTLGVGLGGEESTDYARFGESADPKALAEKLDESLELISGLWSGKAFGHEGGRHYSISKKTVFLPRPVQKPRIPIWVAGMWPRRGPFRRAAKWDGMIPLRLPGELLKASELPEIVSFVNDLRIATPARKFDVVVIGWSTGKNRAGDRRKVAEYAAAGATWWLESLYTMRDSPEHMLERIEFGPPR